MQACCILVCCYQINLLDAGISYIDIYSCALYVVWHTLADAIIHTVYSMGYSKQSTCWCSRWHMGHDAKFIYSACHSGDCMIVTGSMNYSVQHNSVLVNAT